MTSDQLFQYSTIDISGPPSIIFIHDMEEGTEHADFLDQIIESVPPEGIQGLDVAEFIDYESSELVIPAISAHAEQALDFDLEESELDLLATSVIRLSTGHVIVNLTLLDDDESSEDSDEGKENWD